MPLKSFKNFNFTQFRVYRSLLRCYITKVVVSDEWEQQDLNLQVQRNRIYSPAGHQLPNTPKVEKLYFLEEGSLTYSKVDIYYHNIIPPADGIMDSVT